MIDEKLTPYDVKNIVLLNNIMNNNEYFLSITSTDTGCINHRNVHLCTRVLELYTYLIKNYKIIPNVFTDDMHANWSKMQYIMGQIDNNNTPISTILKSIGVNC